MSAIRDKHLKREAEDGPSCKCCGLAIPPGTARGFCQTPGCMKIICLNCKTECGMCDSHIRTRWRQQHRNANPAKRGQQ